MNMALVLMAKEFKLNYFTPTNNNHRISSNPRNRHIAQPNMNMGQDRQMQMVGGQIAWNQNGLIVVSGIANQNTNQNVNGNVVAAWAEDQGEGMLLLQAEEFDLMAVTGDIDEIEEVNANYILMVNLQQASTSGTQTDKALVYDSDGSAEVHHYENCYDNEIFHMFTQEEQYTELLEPITEPHPVQQNTSNVIFDEPSVEHNGGIVKQHPATIEETRAYFESLYNNLVTEVEKVNTIDRKMKETNADLTTKLARLSYEKDKCTSLKLSKEKSTVSYLQEERKILKDDFKTRENKLLDKLIESEKKTSGFINILVKTGQSIQTMHMLSPELDSFYHIEHKMTIGYENPHYLKKAQKKQQSLYNGKVLLDKHDLPALYDSKETLQLAQESRLKMKQLNKEIKPTNYAKINKLSEDFVSQKAKSREEFEECKYDKIAYNKAYNNMKKQTERLQAQLGDLKGQSMNTSCESNTLDPLSQKLDDENVSLEFQLRAQLVGKFSKQNDAMKGTSANTKFAKSSTLGTKLYYVTPFPKTRFIPKVVEKHDLTKPVTSHSVLKTQESIVVKNEKVIAPGIFRINPTMNSRVDKVVPNKPEKTSVRTKPITVSQPNVITKKDVNSDSNSLSSTRVDSTTKTRIP
ncbi:hypothetical protein Tco_0104260 [Tanacetum coccineum]